MTELQKAIIISSMIGSILANYDPRKKAERGKGLVILRKRLKKMMMQRSKSNRKEFIEAIQVGDKVWRDAVNHFSDKNISIEAVSITIRLYHLYSTQLQRFANIGDRQIDAFAMGGNGTEGHEKNSFIVADYILKALAPFTGEHLENKLSLRKTIIKQNLILEGKYNAA